MKLAMIGLGKMGANMTERLLLGGHEVVAYDRWSPEAVATSVAKGAIGVASLEALASTLGAPGQRIVWIMVPSGAPTQSTIDSLAVLLTAGDIVIDGGNSKYRDTQVRHAQLGALGITLLDAGTSGGVWGLANGYCLMIGGPNDSYARCEPIFATLAPEGGLIHVDEQSGSGHFVKMVHNGMEYAMMQSYAEGFEIIEKSPFNVDQAALAETWMHGSVVRSWLLELLAGYLAKDPELSQLKAYVDDSGEGRWTVEAAIEYGAPAPAIAAALFARFASREDNAYGLRMLSAMRNAFGGHEVKKA